MKHEIENVIQNAFFEASKAEEPVQPLVDRMAGSESFDEIQKAGAAFFVVDRLKESTIKFQYAGITRSPRRTTVHSNDPARCQYEGGKEEIALIIDVKIFYVEISNEGSLAEGWIKFPIYFKNPAGELKRDGAVELEFKKPPSWEMAEFETFKGRVFEALTKIQSKMDFKFADAKLEAWQRPALRVMNVSRERIYGNRQRNKPDPPPRTA